jgi:hypothetical protein
MIDCCCNQVQHVPGSSRDLSALRAFDADDGKSHRTPSAWIISLATVIQFSEAATKACANIPQDSNFPHQPPFITPVWRGPKSALAAWRSSFTQ